MRLLTIILFILTLRIATAQNTNRYQQIDSLLTERYKNDQFSGVIIVAEKNQIVYSGTFGYADIEQKTPFNIFTQFDLSSGAKLFTAAAIGQLADKKKLKFYDKVSDYFPELKFGKKITIHHLFTHSSGLGDFQSKKNFTYENVNSCIDVLPFLIDDTLKFNPGDSALYATSNLPILGAIIEKISGLTFPMYVDKHILKSLNLKRTTFDNYFTVQSYTKNDGRYARGYVKDKGGLILEKKRYPSKSTFVGLSSGGMWSSAKDLLTFDNALYSGKLISSDMLKLMTTKHVFSEWEGTYFGYVFHIINSDSKKEGVGHAGNSSGHHSFNFHYDNRETTLIILDLLVVL